MRILVVQQEEDGHAGVIGERIDAALGERVTVHVQRGEAVPESPAGFAAALFLGGSASVAEGATPPPDPGLFPLARAFHDTGKPLLGICLGAQILARALGARVYRHERVEFGFCPVALTREGQNDPLFSGLGPTLRVMQWHEDTFDLPSGAVLLAQSEGCRHQAYRVGASTYGVQFHPEVDRSIVTAWGRSAEAYQASRSPDPAGLLESQMAAHLGAAEAIGRTLAERWMKLVRELG